MTVDLKTENYETSNFNDELIEKFEIFMNDIYEHVTIIIILNYCSVILDSETDTILILNEKEGLEAISYNKKGRQDGLIKFNMINAVQLNVS